MLPGEAIRGTSTFEWLDGRQFVIWRSHYDHSQIPDAITIIGVTDGQLSMHYFDHRHVAVLARRARTRLLAALHRHLQRRRQHDHRSRSAIEGRQHLGGRS